MEKQLQRSYKATQNHTTLRKARLRNELKCVIAFATYCNVFLLLYHTYIHHSCVSLIQGLLLRHNLFNFSSKLSYSFKYYMSIKSIPFFYIVRSFPVSVFSFQIHEFGFRHSIVTVPLSIIGIIVLLLLSLTIKVAKILILSFYIRFLHFPFLLNC